jgi:hypothetical protein
MKLLGIILVVFQHNKSATDHIFCIHQSLEKKWKFNETVHQLIINFKKSKIRCEEKCCTDVYK